jgi:hypothetical protein
LGDVNRHPRYWTGWAVIAMFWFWIVVTVLGAFTHAAYRWPQMLLGCAGCWLAGGFTALTGRCWDLLAAVGEGPPQETTPRR